MLLNKILQGDYTVSSLYHQIKLPLDIEISIPSDDPVRLVSAFVEEMNLSDLYETYDRIRKNQATGVDSEYVTWLDVFPAPTDTITLIPFLKDMEVHLTFKYKNIVADAGYESEENYIFIESIFFKILISLIPQHHVHGFIIA